MTDVHTKEQRSYNMSMIKWKNTNPEIKLRKTLYKNGIRGYRIHSKIFGNPDIVFLKYQIVIFVDGCFWHKCPKCFVEPETNKFKWLKKINENVKRDKNVNKILKKEGWKVLRFWEHQIKNNVDNCYKKINMELIKRGYKNDS